MSGTLPFIPTTLPPGLYEQASGNIAAHATGGSASLTSGTTGTSLSRPSAVQPQFTGQASLQQQYTGSGLKSAPAVPPRPPVVVPAFPIPQQASGQTPQWDVTATDKLASDKFFDSLDAQKRGFIEGDVAVPFMLQSKLSEDVLAQIWYCITFS